MTRLSHRRAHVRDNRAARRAAQPEGCLPGAVCLGMRREAMAQECGEFLIQCAELRDRRRSVKERTPRGIEYVREKSASRRAVSSSLNALGPLRQPDLRIVRSGVRHRTMINREEQERGRRPRGRDQKTE